VLVRSVDAENDRDREHYHKCDHREIKPCEYCETQHYEEFVLRELLNRVLIDLSEAGVLNEMFEETD